MIPQQYREAVSRSLQDAFQVAEFDDIAEVAGGHTTSLVYRIAIGGTHYLLKIITRPDDPGRHYRSMRSAAEEGLAPHVWYTNVADKVSITDFVVSRPLSVPEALVLLPAVLRNLHALPVFEPAPFNTTCTFLLGPGAAAGGFLQKFQEGGLLPDSEGDEFAARHAELSAAYPSDGSETVASHNDLFKPDNVLFDGTQVWLVDWEAAFQNDRYADLAAVTNQIVTNGEEESAFLERYFGAPPTRYQIARLHLMQQIAHLFYTMAFLSLGAAGGGVDWSEPTPDFREFNHRMWAGQVDLSDPPTKIRYGKAHWKQLLANVRQPRYQEALKTIQNGPTTS